MIVRTRKRAIDDGGNGHGACYSRPVRLHDDVPTAFPPPRLHLSGGQLATVALTKVGCMAEELSPNLGANKCVWG